MQRSVVYLGSNNIVKANAVRKVTRSPIYSDLKISNVRCVDISSSSPRQPTSIEATVTGAIERAKKAFESFPDALFGIGIEDGICEEYVPRLGKTAWGNICFCAIYNGQVSTGSAPWFRIPDKLAKLVLNKGIEMNEARRGLGIVGPEGCDNSWGLIGVMSKGKTTRSKYTRWAVETAMSNLMYNKGFWEMRD